MEEFKSGFHEPYEYVPTRSQLSTLAADGFGDDFFISDSLLGNKKGPRG